MLKSVVATITRFKQNDDQNKSLRETEEEIKVSSVQGNPEYCKIETSAGDALLVKGIDLIEAVKHSCNGEK